MPLNTFQVTGRGLSPLIRDIIIVYGHWAHKVWSHTRVNPDLSIGSTLQAWNGDDAAVIYLRWPNLLAHRLICFNIHAFYNIVRGWEWHCMNWVLNGLYLNKTNMIKCNYLYWQPPLTTVNNKLYKNHRISIPAYAIEQQWWQLGVSKNEISLMSFISKIMLVLYQSVSISDSFKYLLTRQQMVFHLFFALTVSIRSWVHFPTLCRSINTKSMIKTESKT
jgi:hypothetical protein